MNRTRLSIAALAAVLALSAFPGGAQHSAEGGHLPASQKNVELVGRVRLSTVGGSIGDVSGLGQYAYVAAWAGQCAFDGQGGVHIVSLAVPQVPLKVGYIPAGANTAPGEGVQALHVSTPKFDGDILVVANEPCGGGSGLGGFSLWDITDPLNPVALVMGAGEGKGRAHFAHSAFAWDGGKKAYVVAVDNEELGHGDIDIFDITNPRKPKKIAETGLTRWIAKGVNAKGQRGMGTGGSSNFHDVWVRKVGKTWTMLASYWDTGWVLLNVNNPRKPKFMRDSDFPRKDAATGLRDAGNAHQAVFSQDGKSILGTTEDLSGRAEFLFALVGGGFRQFPTEEPLGSRPFPGNGFSGVIQGPTVYGGTGCAPDQVPPASSTFGKLPAPLQPVVVLTQDGGCSMDDKLRAAAGAGYALSLIAANHLTSQLGQASDRVWCPSLRSSPSKIRALCVGHRGFHELFRTDPQYAVPILGEPEVGEVGAAVGAGVFESGAWGNLRLLNAKTMKQLDAYAIPEAVKKSTRTSYGNLSVHELKVDQRKGVRLGYVSWYAGGLRVINYNSKRIKEVGHYLAPEGSNYWGIYPLPQAGEAPLLLLSDMDYGLYVLRYTGPGQPTTPAPTTP